MDYWLDLFTGETWKEYRDAGAKVSGFRQRRRRTCDRVKPGDYFLAYLTGVMRWVGILRVVGPSKDQRRIWAADDFPVRFDVEPLVVLDPEYGVPMEKLEGKLEFYEGPQDRGKFKGFLRGSPSLFKGPADGALLVRLLEEAQRNPVALPFDPRKLARPVYRAEVKKGKTTVPIMVTVPEADEPEVAPAIEQAEPEISSPPTRHTEMQFHLLRLGLDMGLDIWVARNDRSRLYEGQTLGELPNMLAELPTQFNDATNRTIELIDVLWLKGHTIVAAFEVECTTSIFSGLLRMSDLLALQPNLEIPLYLVAPDERRAKVSQEILRPTFAARERPLPEVCGFLSFSNLMEKVDGIRKLGLASSLKPDFLRDAAEYFAENADDQRSRRSGTPDTTESP